MTAEDILKAARSQIGTAFVHQGRLPGKALDCAGLAAFVAHSINAVYNEWPGYGRNPQNGLLKRVMDNQPCLYRVFTAQPGDILLIRFAFEPRHIAICAGKTIIHSHSDAGQVSEHEFTSEWKKRVVAIYRFKGLQ